MLEDDVFAQIFQAHALKLVQDALLELEIVFASQRVGVVNVGDVRQDLQAVAARRRDGGIRPGGSHEIDGRIVRQLVALKDLGEMFLLMAAEKEVVVRELGILAIKAQFHHKTGTGGLEFPLQR